PEGTQAAPETGGQPEAGQDGSQTEKPQEARNDEPAQDPGEAQNPEPPQGSPEEQIVINVPPTEPSDAGRPAVSGPVIDPSGIVMPSWITQDIIHINEISRPALAINPVTDIVIHYVGNAGSSAKGNRDYFDSLDDPRVEGWGRKASAHLVVGLEGEVIQCLPLNELAYATSYRNWDTISVEVCHPDETGKFSNVTYQTVVKLTAWLLQQFGLSPDHVIRHYDCSGKMCPVYYVENEAAWEQLKADIAAYYYANPNIR
ncbi:MAG: N-acetylmuramoyl-L-alanine amidase, partial [Parasporobacterium sp.]|nr:N-acetylmuramoyl-L-alanine amidase [Parasporobacterium sp.]